MSKGNFIDCVLIDVQNGGSKIRVLRHFEDTLEALYSVLHCSTIDIPSRFCYPTGKSLCFVVDDEGLFVESPTPSVVFYSFPNALKGDCSPTEVFVGNVLITGPSNAQGELTSLTNYEISEILDHFRRIEFVDGSKCNVFICPTQY